MRIFINDVASEDIDNDFILGTAINIDCIYDDPPESVIIKIENPSYEEVVLEAMTAVNTKVYNYVFQTNNDNNQGLEGEYIITIYTTIDGNESVIQEFFNAKRPAPYGSGSIE